MYSVLFVVGRRWKTLEDVGSNYEQRIMDFLRINRPCSYKNMLPLPGLARTNCAAKPAISAPHRTIWSKFRRLSGQNTVLSSNGICDQSWAVTIVQPIIADRSRFRPLGQLHLAEPDSTSLATTCITSRLSRQIGISIVIHL
jgi:hypothetical protein